MGRYLALRDLRLSGGIPARPNLTIVNTGEKTPISQAIGQIKAYAHWGGKIDWMFILCHGWYWGVESAKLETSVWSGGWGLEVGDDGIQVRNVAKWKALAGAVSNIVIYSCGAAESTVDKTLQDGDGQFLMRMFAMNTQATVYAPDDTQIYQTDPTDPHSMYDWGAWEGQLWRFSPDSGGSTVVARAPVEFEDVMMGKAP